MKSPKRSRKGVEEGPQRPGFLKDKASRSQGAPHLKRAIVAATFAMTVDGKITTRKFSPVDFASREDKAHLFHQRSLGEAVSDRTRGR